MSSGTERFSIVAADGATLTGHQWRVSSPARAVVALAHGLGEHSLRYAPVAEALTGAGFDVVAVDHRGHGLTARSRAELGSLGPRGWDGVVDDYGRVVEAAAASRPGRPVVALGHSLGSFVVQTYLLDHSDRLSAAVLSGTTALDEIAALLDPSVEIDLSMFNAAFQPARTDYDWLSRDPAQVDAYIADPWCGFGLQPESVGSLKAAAPRTGDVAAIGTIRRGFPLYVLSGTDDPIHMRLAWLDKVVARYRDAGLDVTARHYDGGRHEMFNETNRDEVLAELVAWLDSLPALRDTTP
jgi:alpha-beta hydrolase superfamily lysophospholipase